MITFIVPAYKEPHCVKMFVGALLCQTNPNWTAIIYHNGPGHEEKTFISSIGDHRIKYRESESNTGYWGTYNRQAALSMVETKYVIQTSIQDYWMPTAVEEILKYDGIDFIYWNSINHLFGYRQVLNSDPSPGWIDWGNFAVKTNIAREVGIKYPKEFRADGLFVKDCFDSGLIKTKIKSPNILTVHN